MKTFIVNYIGFDITFDDTNEKFESVISEEIKKESSSFSAVKKFIDDFKKENQNFAPFWVEAIPKNYGKYERLKVIGIRKDDGLVVEKEDGSKSRLSSYDEQYYMLFKENNTSIINKIANVELERDAMNEKLNEKRGSLIDQLEIVRLNDFKKTLI